MKKLILLALICCFSFVLVNCSSDDTPPPNGPDPVVVPRVVVNSTVAEPAFISTDETVWNSVAQIAIDIQTSGLALPSSIARLTADSVYMQAISSDSNLYLRFQWNDTSHNVWRDHYYVTDTTVTVTFIKTDSFIQSNEDQLYVMFNGAVNGWDTWGWRALTTGGGGFAQGFTLVASDSLTTDAVGTSPTLEVAIRNTPRPLSSDPNYVHLDTSDFTGSVLYFDSAIHWSTVLKVKLDTLDIGPPLDTVSRDIFWPTTRGWDIGQKVPGWLIYKSMATRTDAALGSRWDTKAISSYDDATSTYTLILKRKLATGFSEDLDMSTVDSVKTRLAILNNMTSLLKGDTDRGLTKDFWLIF